MSMVDYDTTAFNYFLLTVLLIFIVAAGWYVLSTVWSVVMSPSASASVEPGDDDDVSVPVGGVAPLRMKDGKVEEVTDAAPLLKARTRAEAKKVKAVTDKDMKATLLSVRFIGTVLLLGAAIYAFSLLSAHVQSLQLQSQTFDPYEILEIDTSATESEIKKARRRLSLLYHPDKQLSRPESERLTTEEANRMIDQITDAYTVLTDEVARENWKLYGNPHGKQAMELSIGLPAWLVDSFESQQFFIIVYLVGMIIIFPILIKLYQSRMRKYDGNVHRMTNAAFYLMMSENSFLRKFPEALACSQEVREVLAHPKASSDAIRRAGEWLIAKKYMDSPKFEWMQGGAAQLPSTVVQKFGFKVNRAGQVDLEDQSKRERFYILKQLFPETNLIYRGNVLLHLYLNRVAALPEKLAAAAPGASGSKAASSAGNGNRVPSDPVTQEEWKLIWEDIETVLYKMPTVMGGLIDFVGKQRWPQTVRRSLQMAQCFTQARLPQPKEMDDASYEQLPHLDERMIRIIRSSGPGRQPLRFGDFVRLEPARREAILRRLGDLEEVDIKEIMRVCQSMPQIRLITSDNPFYVEKEVTGWTDHEDDLLEDGDKDDSDSSTAGGAASQEDGGDSKASDQPQTGADNGGSSAAGNNSEIEEWLAADDRQTVLPGDTVTLPIKFVRTNLPEDFSDSEVTAALAAESDEGEESKAAEDEEPPLPGTLSVAQQVYAPHLPMNKREIWWALLSRSGSGAATSAEDELEDASASLSAASGKMRNRKKKGKGGGKEKKTNEEKILERIVPRCRLTNQARVVTGEIQFPAPRKPGRFEYTLSLVCDAYLGLDLERKFKLTVVNKKVAKQKRHEHDEEVLKNAGKNVFSELLEQDEEEEDSDDEGARRERERLEDGELVPDSDSDTDAEDGDDDEDEGDSERKGGDGDDEDADSEVD